MEESNLVPEAERILSLLDGISLPLPPLDGEEERIAVIETIMGIGSRIQQLPMERRLAVLMRATVVTKVITQ